MRNLLTALLLLAALAAPAMLTAPVNAFADDPPVDGALDITGSPQIEQGADAQRAAALPASAAPAAGPARATLTQYSTPILPTNLLAAPDGLIWYSSFAGNALGSLDPATLLTRVYQLPEPKQVFGIARDAAGSIWYSTTNAPVGNDSVGRLNPVTGLITEWTLPRNHYGLRIDPNTQAIWFVSKGVPTDQLVRLTPQNNQMTRWNVSPYTDTFDIDLAPNGDVWFTVQPRMAQGVGRLNPANGQTTVWKLPTATARPFRLQVVDGAEIWLSEFDPTGNSISRLTPALDQLTRFPLPSPNSGPYGLVKIGGLVWFTEFDGNRASFLDPTAGAPQTATLQKSVYTAPSTMTIVTPVVFTPNVLKGASSVSTVGLTGASHNGFTQFSLPTPGSLPLGIIASAADEVWFTQSGGLRIGHLQLANQSIFVPILYR